MAEAPVIPPPVPAAGAPSASVKYSVDGRWSPVLTASGFTPVAVSFLDNYSKLSPPITPAEAIFIIHLIRYKWTADAPYPGFKSIAEQMGISVQMARHHARNLEQKKYLSREMRVGATNRFHLEPLFAALERRLSQLPPKQVPPITL